MRTFLHLFTLAFLPVMLTLAGCSYSPARVTPEPLIVVDGDRHYHEGRHRHRHWDRDDHDRYYDRRKYDHRRYDGYRHDRRYDDRRYDERRRGGFCPPGLAMQGRC